MPNDPRDPPHDPYEIPGTRPDRPNADPDAPATWQMQLVPPEGATGIALAIVVYAVDVPEKGRGVKTAIAYFPECGIPPEFAYKSARKAVGLHEAVVSNAPEA